LQFSDSVTLVDRLHQELARDMLKDVQHPHLAKDAIPEG
jgi:hypothetical protein